MKFTKFEKAELRYKLEVIIDSEEWLQDVGRTEADIDALIKKVESNGDFEEWEMKLLAEEAENLLDIAEQNLDAGFPEYKNDVRKLRKLNAKFEVVNA